MDLLRREEFLNILLNHQDSEQDFIARVKFEVTARDNDAVTGALLDYFIFSDENNIENRYDLVKECMTLLSDEWLLFFYDALESGISPVTPIPKNNMSLLTEDVQGTFEFIDNPYL